jgi:hypothetical protein
MNKLLILNLSSLGLCYSLNAQVTPPKINEIPKGIQVTHPKEVVAYKLRLPLLTEQLKEGFNNTVKSLTYSSFSMPAYINYRLPDPRVFDFSYGTNTLNKHSFEKVLDTEVGRRTVYFSVQLASGMVNPAEGYFYIQLGLRYSQCPIGSPTCSSDYKVEQAIKAYLAGDASEILADFTAKYPYLDLNFLRTK